MRDMKLLAVTVLTALALSGCARTTDLEPQPGAQLPPAAYGEAERPSAEDLLKRPVQAAPERDVELRTRSEAREEDPFDLPPKE